MNAAVLFLVFNRPETTQQVFDAIRKARPPKLYVAADGPRKGRPDEESRCRETRSLSTRVDWPCQLYTLFRTENLGCRDAVSSAITWFFESESEGIILEDDCLPDPSFFTFCERMLEHYRMDSRIMHIGGANFQQGRIRGEGSYYVSRYPHIWGWATWRRAWNLYDRDMKTLDRFIEQDQLYNVFPHPALRRTWLRSFRAVVDGTLDTWDHQWTYTLLGHSGLAILPNKNLVSNIGFGYDAHHTVVYDPRIANLPTAPIGPIIHPTFLIADRRADEFTTMRVFSSSLLRTVARILARRTREVFSWVSPRS